MIINGKRIDKILDEHNERLNQGNLEVNELVEIMHTCRGIGFKTKETCPHVYSFASSIADRACKKYVAHLIGQE